MANDFFNRPEKCRVRQTGDAVFCLEEASHQCKHAKLCDCQVFCCHPNAKEIAETTPIESVA